MKKNKIVIIASFSQSLINFRGHLIKDLAKNNTVIALAPDKINNIEDKLKNLGADFKKINLIRTGMNPFVDIISFIRLTLLLKRIRPNFVISYTVKPIIYGSLAAKLSGSKNIFSIITGLGYSFYNKTIKQKFVGFFVNKMYKISLKSNKKIFFQNQDDLNFFVLKKIIKNVNNTVKINGSGVDLDYFYKSKPQNKNLKFLIIARLLKEKGILNFLDAAENLKKKYPDSSYHIIGWKDNGPSAVDMHQIRRLHENKTIYYHGYQADVRKFIEECSVFVLPSFREGTPRTCLEAMSMCKPIITCETPGCKETVISEYNGFLVPVNNSKKLIDAMEKFILNPKIITKMGENSRLLAEKLFDVHSVNKAIINELGL